MESERYIRKKYLSPKHGVRAEHKERLSTESRRNWNGVRIHDPNMDSGYCPVPCGIPQGSQISECEESMGIPDSRISGTGDE